MPLRFGVFISTYGLRWDHGEERRATTTEVFGRQKRKVDSDSCSSPAVTYDQQHEARPNGKIAVRWSALSWEAGGLAVLSLFPKAASLGHWAICNEPGRGAGQRPYTEFRKLWRTCMALVQSRSSDTDCAPSGYSSTQFAADWSGLGHPSLRANQWGLYSSIWTGCMFE